MKRAHSLEEEREALLEQIHSSRAAYRRMLAQYDQPELPSTAVHAHIRNMPAAFPRSMTMRWILNHPWGTAGAVAGVIGVAAILVIGPRRVLGAVRAVPNASGLQRRLPMFGGAGKPISTPRTIMSAQQPVVMQQKQPTGGAVLAAVTGLVSMMLRDPQRLRAAGRALGTGMEWLRRRRAQGQLRSPGTVQVRSVPRSAGMPVHGSTRQTGSEGM